MTDFQSPKIHTKRLILTWPTPEQVDDYFHAIVGSDIFDTLLWDGPNVVQELHDWWAQGTSLDPDDPKADLHTAVIERTSGRYIGGVSLCPDHNRPYMIDIGFALAPHAHGKGYATEALGALVDVAFSQRGAQRVFGKAFAGNNASRRVMEKLGFVLEGTLRRYVCKQGIWIDEWLLAIIRPDWEKRQEQFRDKSPV